MNYISYQLYKASYQPPATLYTLRLFCVKQTYKNADGATRVNVRIYTPLDDIRDDVNNPLADDFQTLVDWKPNAEFDWDSSDGRDYRMRNLGFALLKRIAYMLEFECGGKLVIPDNINDVHKALYMLCCDVYNKQEATGNKDFIEEIPVEQRNMDGEWNIVDCGAIGDYVLRIFLKREGDTGKYHICLKPKYMTREEDLKGSFCDID